MSRLGLLLLNLQEGINFEDDNLQQSLKNIRDENKIGSGASVEWFRQVEDAGKFYLFVLGAGDAQEARGLTYLEKILGSFESLFSIEWSLNLDMETQTLPLDASVVAIGQHFIEAGKADKFYATFSAVKHHLQSFPALRGMAGGWRENCEGDAREWVLFTGWDEVSQHRTFPQSNGFQEYKKVLPFLSKYEVNHAVTRGV